MLTGGLWHGVSIVLPQAFTLIISVAAARTLGVEQMGQQSFIAFVELSLVMVATGGVSTSLMRFIGETVGRDRSDVVRRLVFWAWRIEIVAGVVGGAALLAIGLQRGDLRTAWALAALGCVVGVMHAVPTAVLIGLQRWKEAATAGLVTGFLGTIATVVVLARGGGIEGMFAVEVAAGFLTLVWTARLAVRAVNVLGRESAPSRELQNRLLRYSGYCFVDAVLSFVVWKRSEFLFLDRYSGSSSIAYYSVAFAAVAGLSRIPAAFGIVVTPAFATLFGAGATDRIRSGFGRASRMLLFVSLPMTGAALALGPTFLRLVYGDDYRASGSVLVVLLCGFPAVAVLNAAQALMTGFGRVWVPLGLTISGAVLNVCLDIAFIPGHAALGAAAANTVSQIVIGVGTVAYAVKLVGGIRWELRSVLAMTAVSVGIAGAAHLVVRVGLGGAETVVIGLVVEVGAAFVLMALLRPLSTDDAEWLREVGGRFISPHVHRFERR